MPSLLPTLDKYKIVSARTQYEKFYPGQPLCWKAAAFAHEASEALQSSSQRNIEIDGSNSPCPSVGESDVSSEDDSSTEEAELLTKSQIISFGDSMEERTAVRIVSDQLDTTPKSVMFVQSPNPYQIVGQLRLLTKHMDYVCKNGSTLDLEITLDQAIDSAKAYFQEIGCPNLATDDLVTEISKASALRRHISAPLAQVPPEGDDPMQEGA